MDMEMEERLMITELKQKAVELTKGELTVSKVDFILIGVILLLAGICIGLLTAPLTHGISVFSNNGNYNGNNCGNTEKTDNGSEEC